jgi:hypothetical protein
MNLCKCGCEKEIVAQSHHSWMGTPIFIHGHNRKGKRAPSHTKAKMSATWKQKWADPEYREQKCGRECSEETRKKISEAQIGKFVSEATKRKSSKSHLGKTASCETKAKMSIAGMGRIASEETKQKLSIANTGRPLSEEHKKKLSAAHIGKVVSEETKKKIGEAGKKKFSDPEYCRKMMKAWKLKPNKPEILVMRLLDEMYPGEWKYTGDFSVTINGKCPDFVNCNGQKKCIELFGDYWHQGEDPQDRADLFTPFGFDTLVIWEHELKNIDSAKGRIERFCEQ